MNPVKYFYILTLLLVSTTGCKSTEKFLNKGQYDKAFYTAISQLKKDPDHSVASSVLPEAYHQYQAFVLREIGTAKGREAALEEAYMGFMELQKMYDAIAATPGAQKIVKPVDYTDELNTSAQDAASYYYEQGSQFLAQPDTRDAEKAYLAFTRSDHFVRGYKDVQEKIEEAAERATVNVIVNTMDQRFGFYSINANFFENDLLWQLRNSTGSNSFYKFHTYNRGRDIRADQFMDIALYDIWISPVYNNNYSYDVSKNITVPDDKNPDATKIITVTATVSVKRSIIDSRAVMDCRITDAAERRILYTNRFGAQHSWENRTGSYQGDSRALSDADWAIVRGAYNNPPSQDELFRELTRQLLNDFGFSMRQFFYER